jgi:hypothetical protein
MYRTNLEPFLRSSNMRRGERQPMDNQGEILQEKSAPYKLSPAGSEELLTLALVTAWLGLSKENLCSLLSASPSPPTTPGPPAGWLSYTWQNWQWETALVCHKKISPILEQLWRQWSESRKPTKHASTQSSTTFNKVDMSYSNTNLIHTPTFVV